MSLKRMFVIVALVEAFYCVAGLFTPPAWVLPVLGWNLSPDGQWVAKLLGLSLGIQGAIAWVLRRDPPVRVAWLLATYQIAAAAVDCVVWLGLRDQGIFATPMARISIMVAIPTHALLGVLLIAAARRDRTA